MSEQGLSRLEHEIELVNAMYPEQANYNSKTRELKFTQDGATVQLRLPESYPESGHPDIIAASDTKKVDVRAQTKEAAKELGLLEGEEALDAIIAAFKQVLETRSADHTEQSRTDPNLGKDVDSSKTVIVWLHHLLALTKRKLALSATALSGITKPGYPGIMIFSGPSLAVTDHVNTLKAENWQAFQVRYEEDELWDFAHGKGVKEVETMAEVVKGFELGKTKEKGTKQKEEFLKAVGIK
jgi:hypothetical protein